MPKLTVRNRQSVVVHSRQDFLGQVVVEAERVLGRRDAEVRRPTAARDEPTQPLSCLRVNRELLAIARGGASLGSGSEARG